MSNKDIFRLGRFDLNNEWLSYLHRVGFNENDLPEDQLREMKRAFMGACGQMLVMFRQDISTLSLSEGNGVIHNLFMQVNNFWQQESRNQNKQ